MLLPNPGKLRLDSSLAIEPADGIELDVNDEWNPLNGSLLTYPDEWLLDPIELRIESVSAAFLLNLSFSDSIAFDVA